MNGVKKSVQDHLWARVRRYRFLFAVCPFVRMVAICNSLARGTAKVTSDIDLFVVTSPGHLWTARLCLKILTQIFGMRVHRNKIAGRFCLSFFVTENALNLGHISLAQDPLLAEFIDTMKPVYAQKGVYEAFLGANQTWTFPYLNQSLQNHCAFLYSYPSSLQWIKKIKETCCNMFGRWVERFAYCVQIKKDVRRKKIFESQAGSRASVILTENIFKFHEDDPRLTRVSIIPAKNPV